MVEFMEFVIIKGAVVFELIPYNDIKPIDDRTLNENKMNEAIQSRSKFLRN